MKRSVASCFMCRSGVDNKKLNCDVTVLRRRHNSVLAAWELADVWFPPAQRPHLASSQHIGSGFRERTQIVYVRYRSHRHTTSVAQQDGAPTGSTWTGGGKRRQARPLLGFGKLYTCTPGRSQAVFHHRGQRVCPNTVTSELPSSRTAAGGSSGLSST
jgi:hypothetical protein